MSDNSTSQLNSDATAPKFPSERREFIYWKKKMQAFLAVRNLYHHLDDTSIDTPTTNTNPSSSSSSQSKIEVLDELSSSSSSSSSS